MYEKLKKQFEENPLATIAVCALAVNAAAKLIDAYSAAKGRNAYAAQIAHKINSK